MHRLRRLHDSQYIVKNPFTNENSNLSNIFHNHIHRKKVESIKVRSTEEFLCQFAWLPCRFFRGRRQGRQPLNICWSWLPALEHGKIEENTVNSGIFNGWGDKGIGSIVEHDVFDRFYGDKSVKYRALKETIAKTWKHIQRTRDLGDYLGVVV